MHHLSTTFRQYLTIQQTEQFSLVTEFYLETNYLIYFCNFVLQELNRISHVKLIYTIRADQPGHRSTKHREYCCTQSYRCFQHLGVLVQQKIDIGNLYTTLRKPYQALTPSTRSPTFAFSCLLQCPHKNLAAEAEASR